MRVTMMNPMLHQYLGGVRPLAEPLSDDQQATKRFVLHVIFTFVHVVMHGHGHLSRLDALMDGMNDEHQRKK